MQQKTNFVLLLAFLQLLPDDPLELLHYLEPDSESGTTANSNLNSGSSSQLNEDIYSLFE